MSLLMGITSFIAVLLLLALGGLLSGMAGGSDTSGFFSVSGIMLLIVPIVYAVIGFIYGLVAALICNLAAKMCGGLVVRVHTLPF